MSQENINLNESALSEENSGDVLRIRRQKPILDKAKTRS